MKKETIYVDDIVVNVIRKKVKNINLRISKEKIITVSANNKISIERIQKFITLKIDWIKINLDKIEIYNEKKENIKQIQYISGDKIKLEGKEYILMVIENNQNKLEIEENIIYLYTKNISCFKDKQRIFNKFIKYKASERFERSLDSMLEIIKVYGVKKPYMKIRSMKSRWGSCNRSKNIITINLELIKLSNEFLDYVMLHELIHFLVAGHNKEFYNYMTIMMPNWKDIKKLLKHEYLN